MTKAVVVVGFIVAFAAGLVVGLAPRPATTPPGKRPSRHGGWLAAELNLDAQQQEQLNKIWSETAFRGGRDRMDRRRQLFKERDEAVAALIRPEDRPRYEEILRNHAEQMAAMDEEWRASYQSAVDRTKQLLTPEQRAKYEDLLRRHQSERGSRERNRGERERGLGRHGEQGVSSHPASQP